MRSPTATSWKPDSYKVDLANRPHRRILTGRNAHEADIDPELTTVGKGRTVVSSETFYRIEMGPYYPPLGDARIHTHIETDGAHWQCRQTS